MAKRDTRVRTTLRAQQLVWLMGVFALLWAVLAAVGAAIASVPSIAGLPQVAWLEETGTVIMRQGDLSLWVRLLCAAPAVVVTCGLGVSALLLSPVLVSVAGGRSFAGSAERNLRRISATLIVSAVISLLLDFAASWVLSREVEAFQVATQAVEPDYAISFGPHITIPWLPLALGIIAAAFRWVIRDGAALEKEAEGVI
ncbi:hypothetical protein [Pseudactinotalea sp.]|uniref:hypothetical protein n=1 Tax=Pseudactinotalea sp. TaxID=1926260 RepID=UPI003B3A6CFF